MHLNKKAMSVTRISNQKKEVDNLNKIIADLRSELKSKTNEVMSLKEDLKRRDETIEFMRNKR